MRVFLAAFSRNANQLKHLVRAFDRFSVVYFLVLLNTSAIWSSTTITGLSDVIGS